MTTLRSLACFATFATLVASPWSRTVLGGPVVPSVRFQLGTGTALNTEPAQVPIRVSSNTALDGFVMAFEWDGRKADGVRVEPAASIAAAEIVQSRVEDDFIVFGVVMDLDGDGAEVLPAGDDTLVATATILCDCPGSRNEIALAFVDGRHSISETTSLLDNMAIVGDSVITSANGLELINGTLLCEEPVQPGDEPRFACGGALAADGSLGPAQGAPGETVDLCFYYADPIASADGRIRGFSIAVAYDSALSCDDSRDVSVYLSGGELERANTEFFTIHCDNDDADGDGREMVVGALLDLQDPFDGRALPSGGDDLRLLFCVPFTVALDAPSGTCLDVTYTDGLDGRNGTPTDNLVAISFFEQTPVFESCQICVTEPTQEGERFIRGDCNYNGSVNIADASAQIGAFFLGAPDNFLSPCHDACDADNNGSLNVTDVVYLLNYLFIPGSPAPPAPFPTAGFDVGADALTCTAVASPI